MQSNPYREAGTKAIKIDERTVVLAKIDSDPEAVKAKYLAPRPLHANFDYIEAMSVRGSRRV